MSSRFKPSKKPKLIDPIKSERLRRTIRAYNQVDQQYIPNRTNDKQELECSLYKQKYPDNVVRELKTLLRVKVHRGSFELDEDGTADTEGKVIEALVYTIDEKVINPNPDPAKGDSEYFAHCSTRMGVYQKPLAIVKRDDLGNVVSSKVTGQKAMFYIPFTEQTVRKILEEFKYEYKGLALAIAQPNGFESWYGSHKYSAYNLDEFINSNFDDVLGANQGGFLKDKIGRVVTDGAVQKFIMDRAAKREQAVKEFKEFKGRQRGAQAKTKRK